MIPLLALLMLMTGCAEEEFSLIPGSTARISPPVPEAGAKVELQIFHNELACEDFLGQIKPENFDAEMEAVSPQSI